MRLHVGRCLAAIRLHVLLLLSAAFTGGRHVLRRESARERDSAHHMPRVALTNTQRNNDKRPRFAGCACTLAAV